MRSFVLVTAGALGLALLTQPVTARACGGCFHDPSQNPTVVTDHRMILTMSVSQTTLYDQIQYTGSPQSFAWVLPISGTATVGLSSDLVFDVLDSQTHTTVNAPPTNCPAPPANCAVPVAGFTAEDASAGGVQVLTQQVVGPYETVQLASTDPQALNTWLTSHGYSVPADVQPIIDAYVLQGSNFLAMKLVPGASVQAMRPVRVTTQGAAPVLPLRMVAAGTGSTVGITLWVISEGRYEPQNFPSFRIPDSSIVWDWSTTSSNYATLRQAYETAGAGKAWELESSLPLDVTQFTQLVDNGGSTFGFYDYDAGTDYPSIAAADGGDAGETPTQVRSDDLATLFNGLDPSSVRVTRMRSDLGHAALGQDLVLQASADQSVLTNQRYPTQSVGQAPCPSYSFCEANGSDAGGLIGFEGGGCNAARSSEDGNNLVAILGSMLGIVLYRVVRRKRR